MKSIFQVFTFDLVSKVVMGIAGILVIRFMAPAEYARYTVAIAAAGVVSQVLSNAANRVYIVGHRRVEVRDPLHATLGFQLLAIAAGALLAAPLLVHDRVMGPLVVALVAALCLSEFAKTVFQRDLRFTPFSMVELGRSFAFLAGLLAMAALLGERMRAWQVVLMQAATLMLVFAVSMARTVRWREVADLGGALGMLRAVTAGAYRHLFLYFAVQALLSQINIGMLRAFSDDLALASYGSAYRYYALIMLALAAVDKVLLPYVQTESVERVRAVLRGTLRAALLAAGPVLVGAWAAQWVLPAIDMGKYPAAVPTFQILAISSVISLAFAPFASLLMRHEDFRFLLGVAVAAAGLNVALGVPLIARWGAPGAAAAYFVALAVMNVALFVRARGVLAEPADAPRPTPDAHAAPLAS